MPGVRCLLTPGSAVVLLADTEGGASWAHRCDDVLSVTERERAARFVFPGLGERWAAARVLLRLVLGRATQTPAPQLRFRTDRFGKPSTDGVEFSLSHTDSTVLIVLGQLPLGVDVERIPQEQVVLQVVSVLHPREQTELLALPADERPETFARVWVRKEALLKATGEGLSQGLSRDYVGTGTLPVSPIPGKRIHDVELPGRPGHRAALCTARDGVPSPSPIGRFPRAR